MRKIKLYIAMSLNGRITAKDGDVQWLESMPNPDGLDYGYAAMYDSIDTTIQGYNTYSQVKSWDIPFPYSGKKNYVITRNPGLIDNDEVTFISRDHISRIKQIKQEEGKDIWLIGGGQINTLLLEARLIDEIQVFIMPIILTEGIQLFESLPPETQLELKDCISYPTGVVELSYRPVYN